MLHLLDVGRVTTASMSGTMTAHSETIEDEACMGQTFYLLPRLLSLLCSAN